MNWQQNVVGLVYTDLIISTIVDEAFRNAEFVFVYTDLIISTIVDCRQKGVNSLRSLYGLDNFYYRRFEDDIPDEKQVYTDLIISTIVDLLLFLVENSLVYTDLIISTIVDCVDL